MKLQLGVFQARAPENITEEQKLFKLTNTYKIIVGLALLDLALSLPLTYDHTLSTWVFVLGLAGMAIAILAAWIGTYHYIEYRTKLYRARKG